MNSGTIKKNKDTRSLANLEQDTIHEPLATDEVTTGGTSVNIRVYSKRKRLVDSDGVSAKAAIDGLVYAGILKDDSPQFVKEVSYFQTQTEQGEEEETVIDIYKAESNTGNWGPPFLPDSK